MESQPPPPRIKRPGTRQASLLTVPPMPASPVGGAHDNDVAARLEAVHQRQQLGHNAPLHLTLQANHGELEGSSGLALKRHSNNTMHPANKNKQQLPIQLLNTPTCVFSRLGAMESISSMKMMAGEFFSASSNALRRLDSDSPAGERGREAAGACLQLQ